MKTSLAPFLTNPRIPPLTVKYECPETNKNKIELSPILFFHANVFKACACLKHSNFLIHTVKCRYVLQEGVKAEPHAHPEGGPVILNRNPTTSFLTATTVIYAIGAGITAAAGTRLALQLIRIKRFKFYSFQSQDMDALYCYFLSLPPCVRIG